jgi:hypothetical protein
MMDRQLVQIPDLDPTTRRQILDELQRVMPLMAEFARPQAGLDLPLQSLVSLADLRDMAVLQDLFFERRFNSHRPLIGWFIAWGKQVVIRLLNRLLRVCLSRQVELNRHNWNLALAVHLLEKRIERIERAVAEATHA